MPFSFIMCVCASVEIKVCKTLLRYWWNPRLRNPPDWKLKLVPKMEWTLVCKWKVSSWWSSPLFWSSFYSFLTWAVAPWLHRTLIQHILMQLWLYQSIPSAIKWSTWIIWSPVFGMRPIFPNILVVFLLLPDLISPVVAPWLEP